MSDTLHALSSSIIDGQQLSFAQMQTAFDALKTESERAKADFAAESEALRARASEAETSAASMWQQPAEDPEAKAALVDDARAEAAEARRLAAEAERNAAAAEGRAARRGRQRAQRRGAVPQRERPLQRERPAGADHCQAQGAAATRDMHIAPRSNAQ